MAEKSYRSGQTIEETEKNAKYIEEKAETEVPKINRRSTLKLLAALGTGGLFADAASAEDHGDIDVSVDDDRPAGTEPLLQLIAAEYGDVLTEEQISQLESDVASNRGSAETLRAFELANGDDMATTFRAYRGSY